MIVAVSPYHITGREAPAMAALALARRVVTIVPGVQGDAPDSRELVQRVPRFGEFLKSWAWTTPLWKEGLLTTSEFGADPSDDVWNATRALEEDESCAPLRAVLHQHALHDRATYLHAVATDLLKGGPDPSISLPVAAGLDRFGARTGAIVARSHAVSLAQRAEERLGERVYGFTVPLFVQASARRVLHYREVLAEEIASLADAIALAARARANERERREVISAAERLSKEAASRRDELLLGIEDDEVRAVEGVVALTCVRLPWDAVLTSSVRAWEQVSGARTQPPEPTRASNPLPVLRDPLAGASVVTMHVRPVGVPASSR